MKLSAFKFELPEDLIAKYPENNRDESRLMVVHRKTGDIEHRIFKDIVDYFDEKDLMVINDTKVFPARLHGNKEKTGADIEVFLLRELNAKIHLWDALVDPARKIRVGNKLYFGQGELVAEVIDNTTSRGRTIRFLCQDEEADFYKVISDLGQAPIPKYLGRLAEEQDKERFQTVFAKNTGAVAAPSAGLHFTTQLIKRLQLKGVDITPITLHTGLSSFLKVYVEDLTKHKMDSENFEVSAQTAEIINQTMEGKKNICAIGTSSMRALETSVSASGKLKQNGGWTNKFIFPPYEFQICNSLVTNFHKPMTTLLMMACTFGGYDNIVRAYEVAKKEKYRFLNYGDAMLII